MNVGSKEKLIEGRSYIQQIFFESWQLNYNISEAYLESKT